MRVRPRHLGLDLSAVDFLDSSGLRALLVVQQAVASAGRQVRVVGSTPMIDRLLEITGLEALFPHDEPLSGVGRQPDGVDIRRHDERSTNVAGDANAATAVTLVFPPQPRLVRMARLASSALATVAGADVETIDDIKIAVDEVCASLIEAGDGSDVTVGFTVEGDRFEIVGETAGALDLDRERFELSRQILLAVAERHELTTADGDVRFAVTCSLQSGRDGAR